MNSVMDKAVFYVSKNTPNTPFLCLNDLQSSLLHIHVVWELGRATSTAKNLFPRQAGSQHPNQGLNCLFLPVAESQRSSNVVSFQLGW